MPVIGIRELKSGLSKYLQFVARGERITVTERGRPVAVLIPIDEPSTDEPSTARLQAMVTAGMARWIGGQTTGLSAARAAAFGSVHCSDDQRGPWVILYLDTSALVKMYVDEDDAQRVRTAVTDATLVGTSEIAYVELRSAMARRYREGSLESTAYRRVLRDVEADWLRLFLIVVNVPLVRDAGDLAEQYRLRAYDALHLASSLLFQTGVDEPVTFACWDKALEGSAIAAKLQILGSNDA